MKILVIDDEHTVLRNIKNVFEQNNWYVDTADTYETAEKKALQNNTDVIICDYQLTPNEQDRQGTNLLSKIRKKGITTPVIFLTGRAPDEITPSQALDEGADDFITKPWKSEELVSRVKAVARRRFSCDENTTNIIRHGDVLLDIDLKKVVIGTKTLHLGNILFLLLAKFLQKPDTLLRYDEIISYIWGEEAASEEDQKNKLRVHINHLKKMLGKPYAKHLRTVHGEGYSWQT